MKNKRFNASQKAHYNLMSRYHSKGNTDKNRAYGNYHADCVDHQEKQGRVLSKPERKKLFSWWWNYEVEDKKTKYPLLRK